LIGKKVAIVSDIAGTTRDRLMANIEGEKPFLLVDTGGIDFSKESGVIEESMKIQINNAINEAHLLVFVVDYQQGITPLDEEIREYLRKKSQNKPIILAVNKCDEGIDPIKFSEFYQLGLGDPIGVSAIHKHGVDALKKAVYAQLPDFPPEAELELDIPKFSLVGRPNTGKSSLINTLLQEERLIVSPLPGTTRDSIHSKINWKGKEFLLMDTAGIRRAGKIEVGVEKWSLARALTSLGESDVAGLVIDGKEGITSQDKHIAENILNAKTGLIILVNKWDLCSEEEQEHFIARLRYEFPFLSWAPVIFVSAKTKLNLDYLFPLIEEIIAERQKRISTG
ncbi:MAG TPA: ribosome biogenesis GTPase Der, partial [Candidatus Gracilibacteria bacterium]|nr:ribosome biogenesis GTPase Der [Candidatus Gracilibacteria bacterium]